MLQFRPEIVHAESDVESLGTFQVAFTQQIFARQSKLILYSWQNIVRKRRFHVRLLATFNLRAADHIVCASRGAVDVLHHQGYRKATSIMPLVGVDTRIFAPKNHAELRQALSLSGPVIGYIGRLVPEKGVDTLIHGFARMDAPGELLLVGDGPEEAHLRALAVQLAIGDRCRFVPSVVYDDVADYMNVMDILVLPSRTTDHWKEQFGRVLVEAMGCGVVVIGSDSGAIPEVIGTAGFTFPEGDAAALAAILIQLAQQPALRVAKAEAGLHRVQAHFTVERVADQVLEVWRTLGTDTGPQPFSG
jgi:glycosyltransferase involved in cell wall biosynthesis